MALSNALAGADHAPEAIDTTADVTFVPGQGITGIKLSVTGKVPGLTADEFAQFAEDAKKNCPVSQALTGTTITLDVNFTA
jgi:osmotically inducible protein OsmC